MAPRKGKREAKEEVQVSLGPQVCCLSNFKCQLAQCQNAKFQMSSKGLVLRFKPEPAMTPAQTLRWGTASWCSASRTSSPHSTTPLSTSLTSLAGKPSAGLYYPVTEISNFRALFPWDAFIDAWLDLYQFCTPQGDWWHESEGWPWRGFTLCCYVGCPGIYLQL